MTTTIKLVDADGNQLDYQAFALVREISVSTEHKESSYGTGVSAFVSHKAVVPDGWMLATQDELTALTYEVAALVAEACDKMFAERLLVVSAQMADNANYSKPQPVAQQVTAAQPAQAPQAEPSAPVVVGEVRRLQREPKAKDRRPGDTWDVVCADYKLTAEKLELWSHVEDGVVNRDRKFAETIIPHWKDKKQTKVHPLWPSDAWLEQMVCNGSKQPFGKYVRVTRQVGDRTFTTRDGDELYYVNDVKLAVVQ